MSVLLPSMRGAWGVYDPAPPDIGNRVFWWNTAGNAGGTYTDTAATLPAANNARVAAIKSAEGIIYAQSDSTDRPQFRLNQQNNLPGLYFQASNGEFLRGPPQSFISAVQALSTMTVLVVWTPPSAERAAIRFTRVTERGLRIGSKSSNTIAAYRRGNNSVGAELEITNAANTNVAGAALFTYNGFGGTMRLDDSRSGSDTATGDSAEGATWDKSFIGAGYDSEGNPNQFWQGMLFEIIIWDAAADVSQRAAALAYATAKWGLT